MFTGNINQLAKDNLNFRKVVYTGAQAQLVVMCIPPGGEIGEEIHPATDQLLFMVQGDEEVKAVIEGKPFWVEQHGVLFVPAGTKHNVLNKGDDYLKLFTIYSPPEHPDGTIHATKEDAEKER